jgi:hypothetical protein
MELFLWDWQATHRFLAEVVFTNPVKVRLGRQPSGGSLCPFGRRLRIKGSPFTFEAAVVETWCMFYAGSHPVAKGRPCDPIVSTPVGGW